MAFPSLIIVAVATATLVISVVLPEILKSFSNGTLPRVLTDPYTFAVRLIIDGLVFVASYYVSTVSRLPRTTYVYLLLSLTGFFVSRYVVLDAFILVPLILLLDYDLLLDIKRYPYFHHASSHYTLPVPVHKNLLFVLPCLVLVGVNLSMCGDWTYVLMLSFVLFGSFASEILLSLGSQYNTILLRECETYLVNSTLLSGAFISSLLGPTQSLICLVGSVLVLISAHLKNSSQIKRSYSFDRDWLTASLPTLAVAAYTLSHGGVLTSLFALFALYAQHLFSRHYLNLRGRFHAGVASYLSTGEPWLSTRLTVRDYARTVSLCRRPDGSFELSCSDVYLTSRLHIDSHNYKFLREYLLADAPDMFHLGLAQPTFDDFTQNYLLHLGVSLTSDLYSGFREFDCDDDVRVYSSRHNVAAATLAHASVPEKETIDPQTFRQRIVYRLACCYYYVFSFQFLFFIATSLAALVSWIVYPFLVTQPATALAVASFGLTSSATAFATYLAFFTSAIVTLFLYAVRQWLNNVYGRIVGSSFVLQAMTLYGKASNWSLSHTTRLLALHPNASQAAKIVGACAAVTLVYNTWLRDKVDRAFRQWSPNTRYTVMFAHTASALAATGLFLGSMGFPTPANGQDYVHTNTDGTVSKFTVNGQIVACTHRASMTFNQVVRHERFLQIYHNYIATIGITKHVQDVAIFDLSFIKDVVLCDIKSMSVTRWALFTLLVNFATHVSETIEPVRLDYSEFACLNGELLCIEAKGKAKSGYQHKKMPDHLYDPDLKKFMDWYYDALDSGMDPKECRSAFENTFEDREKREWFQETSEYDQDIINRFKYDGDDGIPTSYDKQQGDPEFYEDRAHYLSNKFRARRQKGPVSLETKIVGYFDHIASVWRGRAIAPESSKFDFQTRFPIGSKLRFCTDPHNCSSKDKTSFCHHIEGSAPTAQSLASLVIAYRGARQAGYDVDVLFPTNKAFEDSLRAMLEKSCQVTTLEPESFTTELVSNLARAVGGTVAPHLLKGIAPMYLALACTLTSGAWAAYLLRSQIDNPLPAHQCFVYEVTGQEYNVRTRGNRSGVGIHAPSTTLLAALPAPTDASDSVATVATEATTSNTRVDFSSYRPIEFTGPLGANLACFVNVMLPGSSSAKSCLTTVTHSCYAQTDTTYGPVTFTIRESENSSWISVTASPLFVRAYTDQSSWASSVIFFDSADLAGRMKRKVPAAVAPTSSSIVYYAVDTAGKVATTSLTHTPHYYLHDVSTQNGDCGMPFYKTSGGQISLAAIHVGNIKSGSNSGSNVCSSVGLKHLSPKAIASTATVVVKTQALKPTYVKLPEVRDKFGRLNNCYTTCSTPTLKPYDQFDDNLILAPTFYTFLKAGHYPSILAKYPTTWTIDIVSESLGSDLSFDAIPVRWTGTDADADRIYKSVLKFFRRSGEVHPQFNTAGLNLLKRNLAGMPARPMRSDEDIADNWLLADGISHASGIDNTTKFNTMAHSCASASVLLSGLYTQVYKATVKMGTVDKKNQPNQNPRLIFSQSSDYAYVGRALYGPLNDVFSPDDGSLCNFQCRFSPYHGAPANLLKNVAKYLRQPLDNVQWLAFDASESETNNITDSLVPINAYLATLSHPRQDLLSAYQYHAANKAVMTPSGIVFKTTPDTSRFMASGDFVTTLCTTLFYTTMFELCYQEWRLTHPTFTWYVLQSGDDHLVAATGELPTPQFVKLWFERYAITIENTKSWGHYSSNFELNGVIINPVTLKPTTFDKRLTAHLAWERRGILPAQRRDMLECQWLLRVNDPEGAQLIIDYARFLGYSDFPTDSMLASANALYAAGEEIIMPQSQPLGRVQLEMADAGNNHGRRHQQHQARAPHSKSAPAHPNPVHKRRRPRRSRAHGPADASQPAQSRQRQPRHALATVRVPKSSGPDDSRKSGFSGIPVVPKEYLAYAEALTCPDKIMPGHFKESRVPDNNNSSGTCVTAGGIDTSSQMSISTADWLPPTQGLSDMTAVPNTFAYILLPSSSSGAQGNHGTSTETPTFLYRAQVYQTVAGASGAAPGFWIPNPIGNSIATSGNNPPTIQFSNQWQPVAINRQSLISTFVMGLSENQIRTVGAFARFAATTTAFNSGQYRAYVFPQGPSGPFTPENFDNWNDYCINGQLNGVGLVPLDPSALTVNPIGPLKTLSDFALRTEAKVFTPDEPGCLIRYQGPQSIVPLGQLPTLGAVNLPSSYVTNQETSIALQMLRDEIAQIRGHKSAPRVGTTSNANCYVTYDTSLLQLGNSEDCFTLFVVQVSTTGSTVTPMPYQITANFVAEFVPTDQIRTTQAMPPEASKAARDIRNMSLQLPFSSGPHSFWNWLANAGKAVLGGISTVVNGVKSAASSQLGQLAMQAVSLI